MYAIRSYYGPNDYLPYNEDTKIKDAAINLPQYLKLILLRLMTRISVKFVYQ